MASPKSELPPADLTGLLERLCEAGVEFILVGGLAAVAQGVPTATFDVDIVPRQTPDNLHKLLAALRSLDAHYRRSDGKILRPREAELRSPGHNLLMTTLGPLDVLGTIEQGLDYEDLLPKSIEIDAQGYQVQVLQLETMVALKRQSRHAKDRLMLPILEETLKRLRVMRKKP